MDCAFDLGFRCLTKLQRERHVLKDRHVRIERVVLEDHRDVSVFRSDIVHPYIVDVEISIRDIFQTGDHTQCRRFAAAGRPDKHNEFIVCDLKVEIIDRSDFIVIYLFNISQG